MTNIQPTRTPQESADRLANALNGFTGALNKVKRRSLYTLLSVVVLALSLVVALKFNYDGNVGRCESGNDLRIELNEKFQNLANILIATGVGDTPEGQEVITIFEGDFVTRDCSNINWLGL